MADKHERNPHEVGPDSAGQSGDTQQLTRYPTASNESVEELIEEGNAFEAEAISGVERAADDATAPVQTREVPEDDVPAEYQNDQNRDVA